MATPARAPLRIHPALLAAIIAVCLGAIIYMVSFAVPLRLAGQAYLLIVILLAFRYWPPTIRWVASMPAVHRIAFGALIGAMILGHYTLNGTAYFPYVVWEIFPFVREDDPVECREFIATTESGNKVRLLVEQLFPSIVQFNPPLDGQGNPLPAMEPLVQALAHVYNEHHADDPVRQVDLMVMAVKLHPPASESRALPSCELLKHYGISSGR
jgi:hypothetical protein